MFELMKIIKIGEAAEGLAFSDNFNLGVASLDNCAYVFDPNGNKLKGICTLDEMNDVSYCCGRFGFTNRLGDVFMTDENGNLIKQIDIGLDYEDGITMTKDGFIACCCRCAFFDYNGNKLWDLDVGYVYNGPSHYNGYWYVADDWKKLLIVKDGNVVNKISYGESAWDTAVCGKLLAVSTETHLYLYDISNPTNPKELWNVGGFNKAYQVAFSSNCKYIAVTDVYNKKLKIFNIEGDLIFEKKYKNNVVSVAWKDDRVAVSVGANLFIYHIPPIMRCFG